jgi:hypothetical protein
MPPCWASAGGGVALSRRAGARDAATILQVHPSAHVRSVENRVFAGNAIITSPETSRAYARSVVRRLERPERGCPGVGRRYGPRRRPQYGEYRPMDRVGRRERVVLRPAGRFCDPSEAHLAIPNIFLTFCLWSGRLCVRLDGRGANLRRWAALGRSLTVAVRNWSRFGLRITYVAAGYGQCWD